VHSLPAISLKNIGNPMDVFQAEDAACQAYAQVA
jgi:hypothetical protein